MSELPTPLAESKKEAFEVLTADYTEIINTAQTFKVNAIRRYFNVVYKDIVKPLRQGKRVIVRRTGYQALQVLSIIEDAPPFINPQFDEQGFIPLSVLWRPRDSSDEPPRRGYISDLSAYEVSVLEE